MSNTQAVNPAARAARIELLRAPGIRIAPSVLAADFCRLGEQLASVVAAGADMIHMDVMDGHFVPNISIGVPVVESVRRCTDRPLDVHLMIADPLFYAEPFAKAGADSITFHIEVGPEPLRMVDRLRELGVGVGISLNPGTPAAALAPVLDVVDLVLVMTVWPGFGGQKFIEPMLGKISEVARRLKPHQRLEIDGGIHAGTIPAAARAGADTFVAGSAVFDSPEPAKAVAEMRQLAEAARREASA